MAVNWSQATQSPVYVEQGGKILHWDSGFRLEVNGVPVGLGVRFSYAPNGANICGVSIQVTDLIGNNLAGVFDLTTWLSDSPFGAGFAAHVPTGGFAPSAGTAVFSKVTNICIEALTTVNGLLSLNITDTVHTGYYICTEVPGTGLIAITGPLVALNYG
jgi:hypothetical protein